MKVANRMSYSVYVAKAATIISNIIIKNDPKSRIYLFPNFSYKKGEKNCAKNPAIPIQIV